MNVTTKIFMNGGSQAVRLPAQFRFEVDEVYVRKNPKTGEVILSSKPTNWEGFFAALDGAEIPDNFLAPEERHQETQERKLFADWVE